MDRDEQLRELEERYEGFTVYDRDGDKIGKVDDLFVDETDREEYVGVKMGLFGLSGTTLVPMEIARVNEQERTIEVSETKEHVKDAPNYSDDDEITHDFEDRIRRHFGLEALQSTQERGAYGRYAGAAAGATAGGTAESGAAAGVAGAEGGRDLDRERAPEAQDVGTTPTERPMGGGVQDREIAARGEENEERGLLGREAYQNREGMGAEGSAMGSAGAREGTPAGGVSDLETGEPGRARGEDLDREGISRGEVGDREDIGLTGTTTGSGSVEGDMPRRAGGSPEDEGYPGRGVGDAERSDAPMTSSGGALGAGGTQEGAPMGERGVGEEGFRRDAELEDLDRGGVDRESMGREGIGREGMERGGAGEREGSIFREDVGTTGATGAGREGFGERRGAGGEEYGGREEGGVAREHMGAPLESEPGRREFDDMQDYQSATTGSQPGAGEPSAAPGGAERETGQEGARGQEEEGTLTRVWRRARR